MRAIELSIAARHRCVRRAKGPEPRPRQRPACLPIKACAAALSWLAGLGVPAAGTMAPDLILAHVPRVSWQPPQEIRSFGLPMTWRGMHSSLAPAQAARALAEHTGIFRRAWATPGRIVLSGTHGATHWVAELLAEGRGSTGVVSSLSLDASGLRRVQDTRAALHMDWMPPQAYLRASHASEGPGGRVQQQIYAAPWPVAGLRARVEERLQARGWLRAAVGAIPKARNDEVVRAWHKNGRSLLLTFVPLAGGSAVYVRLDHVP